MTHAAWFPPANRTAQNYASAVPRPKQKKLNVLVLRTTEGGGWPGFGGGRKAPNLTLNCTSGKPQWRQHWPLPCASMALRQPSGSPSTNRMNVCQVELVGTGGWATRANPHRDYTVSGAHTDWTRPDDMMLRAVADLIAWLHREWELPLTAPWPFGDWTGDHNHRMTSSEWLRFTGVCGHQHVWGNDHTDPGAFPIARCLAMARGGSTPVPRPAPATPKPEPIDPTGGDETMHGCWYHPNSKDKNTRVYLLFNEVSGFYHEFSNGTGRGALSAGYVNPIAKNWDTKAWPEITAGHAKAVKHGCDLVRKGA